MFSQPKCNEIHAAANQGVSVPLRTTMTVHPHLVKPQPIECIGIFVKRFVSMYSPYGGADECPSGDVCAVGEKEWLHCLPTASWGTSRVVVAATERRTGMSNTLAQVM
jgi:hypothetical protein